jgi:hypothetical protein
MFHRKKKETKTVQKTSLNLEQLSQLIEKHPAGLKFEEIQEALLEKNVEAPPSFSSIPQRTREPVLQVLPEISSLRTCTR